MTSIYDGHGRRSPWWNAGWTVLGAAILGVLLFGPIPDALRCGRTVAICDFGHFVLFAATMLWLWVISNRKLGPSLCMSVFLAGTCEAAQFFAGRTVSIPDFWRGVLGVLFVAVIIHACEPGHTYRQRASHLVVALALVGWPVAEVLPKLV